MTTVEAVDDATREVLNHLEVAAVCVMSGVKYKNQVDAETLGAALLQLTARLDEIVDVTGVAVVLLPKVNLPFDVTRDVDAVVLHSW